ncbi:MAG TPA: glycosyltransferase [Anaerolineae bacterium]|nr:glycosyltransferase [Anaerolineae bacterium]
MQRKFLFLFSDTGGGHRAAAQAVRDELMRVYGSGAAIAMIDVLTALRRWPFDRFPAWYPAMVGLNGIPWKLGFYLSDHSAVVRLVSWWGWLYGRGALHRLLRQHPADVIVSFHAVPNYALTLARRHLGLSQPLAVVVLDLLSAHAAWFTCDAELILTPTDAARARALRCGVPIDRVQVAGMPTRRAFMEAAAWPRAAARAHLGLPQETPVILLVGGGDGLGPLAAVVKSLVARCPPAHLVVIAGRNQALATVLRALPGPLQVEGFVSDMASWMRAADLLVTKAGPNTLAEAFIVGLPMVFYAAVPGQEAGNVAYVVERGAGLWAPRPEQAAEAVLSLLSRPQARAEMAARAASLARPEATEFIARKLWELAANHSGSRQANGISPHRAQRATGRASLHN